MTKGAKAVLAVLLFVVLAAIAYTYAVRPTKAPTINTEQQSKQTPTNAGAFQLSEGTKARFTLEEDLRGKHITVEGVTSTVNGAFNADRANLAAATIGEIKINARTFVTDSEQRNNAIRRFILKTEDDANEFIVFKVTSINGLPASADLAQALPFTIVGDLTIAGVTKSVTFTGIMSFETDNKITGKAEATVHYPDFGITVPDLPFLANVDKDATLFIDFAATKN